jgi:hypothetical protein
MGKMKWFRVVVEIVYHLLNKKPKEKNGPTKK